MCTSSTHSGAFAHGQLQEVFENIWFVEGGWDMPLLLKPRISRSMTIVRNSDNTLTLINSMQLSEKGLKQLDALGTVKNVIRLASMHGADDGFYKARYNATIYALKDTQYTKGLRTDVENTHSYFEPDVWLDEHTNLPLADAQLWVMNSPKLKEGCIILNRNNGILLAGDVLHNTPKPNIFTNLPAKIFMHLFRLAKPYNIGVGWWLMTRPSGNELRAILNLPFEHVLPIHGQPVIGNAKEKYTKAIEHYAALAERKKWHAPQEATQHGK
ncbi:hypothetical protein [Pseudoalteromonas sp. T1lg23B]|uniref:hypothetical protein n=1 Tax=Pseudoalteromonas sp. T1lg23B TaxID=2077097 RepID=UPI000CF6090C|nr:hypothetical protein [Pseudoalteromonas sp. T1lg23B]